MDEQNNAQPTPDITQPEPADNNQEAPTQEAPTQEVQPPAQEEQAPPYDYLSDKDVKPKDLEKPEITEDMTEEEIERANQKYEVERANQRSMRSEVKSDITDFLSSVDNPEIYRDYRADVEKIAQMEGMEKITTQGLFFLVGGQNLVNALVEQAVGQIRQIDNSNRTNKRPNSPPDRSPGGLPDFTSMSNEEFREFKAKVTSGAIVM